MKRNVESQDRIILFIGVFAILLGIIVNKWTLSLLFDRTILKLSHKTIIYAFEISIITIGLIIIAFRQRITLDRLLLLVASCSFALVIFFGYDFYRGTRRPEESVSYIYDVNIPDDNLAWKPKPGSIGRHFKKNSFNVTYKIDQDGFKSIDNNTETDFNIYFFGDSFTFGHGVTNGETFANIIADQYLKDKVGVYNAGAMGYGLVQMYQRLLSIIDRIERDDLIIFTPLSEDIDRHYDTINQRVNVLRFMVSEKSKQSRKIKFFPYFKNGNIEIRRLETDVTKFHKLKLLTANAPFTGRLFRRIYSGRNRADIINDALNIVDLARKAAENKEAKFVLIFLPRKEECISGKYTFDISEFSYFDIMKYFPSNKSGFARLLLKNDGHWNAEGHRIAAKAIVDTLAKNRIIDRRYFK